MPAQSFRADRARPAEAVTRSPGVAADPDDTSLTGFGYPQQLHRKMGRYASFAAGFSFISVLTTVFQMFGFGYSFGGPAFFWSWLLVMGGQLLVAACFAELAARYPISGSIYQWATRLGGALYGWFTGWLMVIGQIVVVTAAALALLNEAITREADLDVHLVAGLDARHRQASLTGSAISYRTHTPAIHW